MIGQRGGTLGFAATLLLSASTLLQADLVERHTSTPQPWMRKSQPEALTVVTELSPRCPDPADTYIDILKGVLRRAGIRAASEPLAHHEPYLRVEVTCEQPDRLQYTVNIAVWFWAVRPGRSVYSADNSGLYGELHRNASRQEIRRALKRVFQQAIAHYRQANGMD